MPLLIIALSIDEHDRRQIAAVVDGTLKTAKSVARRDQDTDVAVLEDMQHLMRAQHWIDRHKNRPRQGRAEVGRNRLDPFIEPNADPFALSNPHLGQASCCQLDNRP